MLDMIDIISKEEIITFNFLYIILGITFLFFLSYLIYRAKNYEKIKKGIIGSLCIFSSLAVIGVSHLSLYLSRESKTNDFNKNNLRVKISDFNNTFIDEILKSKVSDAYLSTFSYIESLTLDFENDSVVSFVAPTVYSYLPNREFKYSYSYKNNEASLSFLTMNKEKTMNLYSLKEIENTIKKIDYSLISSTFEFKNKVSISYLGKTNYFDGYIYDLNSQTIEYKTSSSIEKNSDLYQIKAEVTSYLYIKG